MKRIIDIPDEDYEFIKNLRYVVLARGNTKTIQKHVIDAIKKGELYEIQQGEWKVNKYGEHFCPKCGHYALYEEDQENDYYEVQSNFCPECGADLKGCKG